MIDQPGGRGAPLRVRCDCPLPAGARAEVARRIARMTRLADDVRRWGRLCPAARRRGFGRMFRSATLFEDMCKTITSCNTTWPSTVRMNERLCEQVGGGAYPGPEQVAAWSADRLQRATGVGYRAPRLVRLARSFLDGTIDPAWFESPERDADEIREAVLRLDGFGPYSAANVLQLLGKHDTLPIDTETYRLFCNKTGVARPANPKELDRRIEDRYEPFRPYRFLAYWFELWRDYESRHGDAWTWSPEEVGRSFTAVKIAQHDRARGAAAQSARPRPARPRRPAGS